MSSATSLRPPQLLVELRAKLGDDAILTRSEDCLPYGKDWTNFTTPRPWAVALPRTTEEVATILRLCSEAGVPVVPSGGRTGLSGGAVAANDELVLSLNRMNRIDTPNTLTQTVRVQAGAINQSVQDACLPAGLFWPVELGSKGSCAVGGNIATNAGGVRVIRYGHTRSWVLSIQVVLMSGEILELSGDLVKNNTGYDLRQLFIGSEGTLGVITEATLKLTEPPAAKETLLFALEGMPSVLALLRSAREQNFPLLAFECFTHGCLKSVMAHRNVPSPLGSEGVFYVLMDVEKTRAEVSERLETWLEKLFAEKKVLDGTLAQGPAEMRKLWEFREGITESLAARGLVYKNDLALPIMALSRFTSELIEIAPRIYPGCDVFFFGHIGDGNLHVNVLKPASMDPKEFLALCEHANDPLFTIIQRERGSIAAEHGIGILKKAFLSYNRTPSEMNAFRAIKRAFDPRGLLNPGKIFDL